MELIVLDKDLKPIGIVDTFESLIWTDRYFTCGDFELVVPITISMLQLLQQDYFLLLKESEHTMVIESTEIKTDEETGNRLVVKGRSLESILERRIIWNQTVLSTDLQNGIRILIDENAINPNAGERKITRLIYEASDDPIITALTVDTQYIGDNLYDAVQKLCESNGIGFKIILTDENEFLFKLYAGTDRSYNQTINPYVIFSPEFDNIANTNYFASKRPLKTVSLVAGEGSGSDRKTAEASWSEGAGVDLERREMFTDASGISQTTSEGTLSDEEYSNCLIQKGYEDLASNVEAATFDGQINPTSMFVYGQDFFMGDIVQIANEYDLEGRVQVIELIHSESESEVSIYPTFNTYVN